MRRMKLRGYSIPAAAALENRLIYNHVSILAFILLCDLFWLRKVRARKIVGQALIRFNELKDIGKS